MIAEKQTQSNIGVGLGFVLSIGGRVLASQATGTHNPVLTGVGLVLSLVGSAVFIWGCVSYAQGKGYSPWLGLLGLLSCIGLLILVFLPDKYKNGGPGGSVPPGGYVPPQPGVWPPPPGSGPAGSPYGSSQPPYGQPPSREPPPPRKSLGGDDL